MTFAAAFREHVTPRLAHECRRLGLYVAMGWEGFAAAHAEIFSLARDCGAMHLPSEVLDQLQDWIATRLLEAADGYMPTPAEQERRERLYADIEQWNRAVIVWAQETALCPEMA